ncbi:hypothetical protein QBC46DRAFT_460046 [Diplogelasinospora grovesii]|uniref:Fe2OG dioxygenase domain-containing protein n=1 Tax=Diplogelasinospora grovesii TaxID=303347 RepID=A0AAN6N419_9PEZI|nr:hypothetical protein QBC46DRAFT_460046 [Diplogelasinospora grovesii]
MISLARSMMLPLSRQTVASSRALLSTATHAHTGFGTGSMSMPPGFNAAQASQKLGSMFKKPKSPQAPELRLAETKPTSIRDQGLGRLGTMPPGYRAEVAKLSILELPERVTGTASDRELGRAIIDNWRRDGIIQIAMSPCAEKLWNEAHAASRRFFQKPHMEKAACVDSQSYAGYIASGEEITDGVADYSEIFTVTKDLDVNDPRVKAKWPCHGPCPWPASAKDSDMKEPVQRYLDRLGAEGEKLLRLTELGLNVAPGSLSQYTRDGWHHARVLRFPARNATNGKGKEGRGIGSHTDYGLLVISAQDDVGGLFVRPPRQDEKFANWKKSAAGLHEDDDGWVYVPPVRGTHTVILGDMMQYLTNDYLKATPHKVGLNTRERFALAYFHEPSFQAVIKPLADAGNGAGNEHADQKHEAEGIHYGTHFTNMFMRNYPDRITTKRLEEENRYELLSRPELRTINALPSSS